MPTERLSMRRIRDLLRLKYAQGLSDRAAALSLGLSKGTVGNYLEQVAFLPIQDSHVEGFVIPWPCQI